MANLHIEKQRTINAKFIVCIKKGDLIGIKNALNQGADIHTDNEHALILSAQKGYTEVVNLLLEKGANVSAEGDAAFNLAAENGHTAIVKLLYDSGANIYADYCYGLRGAAEKGYMDTVKMMIIDFEMEINNDLKSLLKACHCYETLDIVDARDLNNSISLSLDQKKNNKENKIKL